MRKSKSKSAAMKKADTWFSRYIRLRDADNGGTVSCWTCGKLMHWKEAHAGHFMRRGYQITRYDEVNVQVQCPRCNTFMDGEQWAFGEHLDKWYGPGTANRLRQVAQTICKRTKADFEEIAAHYKAKAEALGYGERWL